MLFSMADKRKMPVKKPENQKVLQQKSKLSHKAVGSVTETLLCVCLISLQSVSQPTKDSLSGSDQEPFHALGKEKNDS